MMFHRVLGSNKEFKKTLLRTNKIKPLATCGMLTGGGIVLQFQDDKGTLVTGVPSTDDESGP